MLKQPNSNPTDSQTTPGNRSEEKSIVGNEDNWNTAQTLFNKRDPNTQSIAEPAARRVALGDLNNIDIRGSDVFADCEVEAGKRADGVTPEFKTLPDFILSCSSIEELAPVLGGCVFQLEANDSFSATTFSSIESVDRAVKEKLMNELSHEWDGKSTERDCSNVKINSSVVRYKDQWNDDNSEHWLSYYEFSAKRELDEQGVTSEEIKEMSLAHLQNSQVIDESQQHHDLIEEAIQEYSTISIEETSPENEDQGPPTASPGSCAGEVRPTDSSSVAPIQLTEQEARESYRYQFCKALVLGNSDNDYSHPGQDPRTSEAVAELFRHQEYEKVVRFMRALDPLDVEYPQRDKDIERISTLIFCNPTGLQSILDVAEYPAQTACGNPTGACEAYIDNRMKQDPQPDNSELKEIENYLSKRGKSDSRRQ